MLFISVNTTPSTTRKRCRWPTAHCTPTRVRLTGVPKETHPPLEETALPVEAMMPREEMPRAVTLEETQAVEMSKGQAMGKLNGAADKLKGKLGGALAGFGKKKK